VCQGNGWDSTPIHFDPGCKLVHRRLGGVGSLRGRERSKFLRGKCGQSVVDMYGKNLRANGGNAREVIVSVGRGKVKKTLGLSKRRRFSYRESCGDWRDEWEEKVREGRGS